MDPQLAIDISRDALFITSVISAPVLVAGMVVGLVIGLLQALTQIQESTLVFVPKILSIFAAVILLLPFMAASMSGLMTNIVHHIVAP